MKKLFSIALALCLLLSVALADVTLTKVYKTEDLVSNTFHNGFVTAIGMTGENTVVLKDDGTYEYTKRLMQTAEDGTVTADIVYTFTGTYTKDGDTVVLMFPTAAPRLKTGAPWRAPTSRTRKTLPSRTATTRRALCSARKRKVI